MSLILELAFVIDDPVGDAQLALAREILELVRNRDDNECVQLVSEIRALKLKYWKGKPCILKG